MELYLCLPAAPASLPTASELDRSVRCGLPLRAASCPGICARNVGGKRLAVGPDGAVLKEFLFPDRHGALQRVDQPAAGLEGRGTVGRSDRNQHAGLADFEPSQAMHDGNVANLKLL